MRLIDAYALYQQVLNISLARKNLKLLEISFAIDNAPTVDAEPVRHAQWEEIELDMLFRCSNCHDSYTKYGTERYCSNCGAKMDGGEPDGR